MQQLISDQTSQAPLVNLEYPSNYTAGGQGVTQRDLITQAAQRQFRFRQEWFEGVLLTFGCFQAQAPCYSFMQSDTPVIELRFALQGNTPAMVNQQPVLFRQGYHLAFGPGTQPTVYQLQPDQGQVSVCEVTLTEAYVQRLTSDNEGLLTNLAHSFTRSEAAILSPQLPITPAMQLLIGELQTERYTGGLRRLFLESRVLDLLLLQAEQGQRSPAIPPRLRPADREKLYQARDLVEQHLSNPYSLKELARQVGLNEFKLKQGFRQLFGTTVFGHLHIQRMKAARKMLLDPLCRLEDVATYCNFAHPRNFVTAFEKYWGISPRQVHN